MVKENFELKILAKQNLKGNWPIAIIICVIAWLLTDAFTGNGGREALANNNFTSFATLVAFIIGGPINFGVAAFFLKLTRNQNAEFMDLFNGFKHFLKTFLLNLLIFIFTFLWFLLLIIPGFVAILKYSMAFYIINDNPELDTMEAIKLSKEMMYGHKARLFYLWLSFIGWFILGILTLGLGFLYLAPYYNATKANFYEDLKANSMVGIYQ